MSSAKSLKLFNAQMQVLRARLRTLDGAKLRRQLRDVRGVGFENQPAVLDVSEVDGQGVADAKWADIVESFRAVGVKPIGVIGIAPEQAAAFIDQTGLAVIDADSMGVRLADRDESPRAEEARPAAVEEGARASAAAPEPDSSRTALPVPPRPKPVEPAWLPPLVIHKQVRSGQQVYARQRDLLVLGAVSPGAEVIADGNVTCYGSLRGRAIAGASGKPDACIHALDFTPELVAVAGLYMTFESGPPVMPPGRIVQVRMDADGDRLIIEAV